MDYGAIGRQSREADQKESLGKPRRSETDCRSMVEHRATQSKEEAFQSGRSLRLGCRMDRGLAAKLRPTRRLLRPQGKVALAFLNVACPIITPRWFWNRLQLLVASASGKSSN